MTLPINTTGLSKPFVLQSPEASLTPYQAAQQQAWIDEQTAIHQKEEWRKTRYNQNPCIAFFLNLKPTPKWGAEPNPLPPWITPFLGVVALQPQNPTNFFPPSTLACQ